MRGFSRAEGGGQENTYENTNQNQQPEKPKNRRPFLDRILGRGTIAALVSAGAFLMSGAKNETARAGGGYPWDHAQAVPNETYTWWIDENGDKKRQSPSEDIDPYGFYYKNCTSFAAWKTAQNGIIVPYGTKLGNAKTWATNAKAAGYKVDHIPQIGDIAVWESGSWGHVAYVEAVDKRGTDATGDDTVRVSEYNQGGNGEYRDTRAKLQADWYIQFLSDEQSAKLNPSGNTTVVENFAKVETTMKADFTGDGYDELFASSQRSDPAQNEIVFRSTQGWLGGSELWGVPSGSVIPFADALNFPADIDGDRKDDLITITPNSNGVNPNIWWQRSTGSSFESPQLVGVPGLVHKNVRWASGDVNGDGYEDVIAFSKRGDTATNILVFRSLRNWLNGAELYGAPAATPFKTTEYLPADQNGDGRTDLYAVVRDSAAANPKIYVLRSGGDHFASPQLTAVPGFQSQNVKFMAGDISGDGKDDLVLSGKRSDPYANLLGFVSDGGYSYSSTNLWSAPSGMIWNEMVMTPADLDKDGDDDMLITQSYNGTNPGIYWLRAHNGYFESPQLVGVPDLVYNKTRFSR